MWLIWEGMFGPRVSLPWCNLSIAYSTANCWQLCWSVLVYDRWYCRGQKQSELKVLVSWVITTGRIFLLGERHQRAWGLLKQHELVAMKTRLLWRGWWMILCKDKQRIRIRMRGAETAEWYYSALHMSITMRKVKSNSGLKLWYTSLFCSTRFFIIFGSKPCPICGLFFRFQYHIWFYCCTCYTHHTDKCLLQDNGCNNEVKLNCFRN